MRRQTRGRLLAVLVVVAITSAVCTPTNDPYSGAPQEVVDAAQGEHARARIDSMLEAAGFESVDEAGACRVRRGQAVIDTQQGDLRRLPEGVRVVPGQDAVLEALGALVVDAGNETSALELLPVLEEAGFAADFNSAVRPSQIYQFGPADDPTPTDLDPVKGEYRGKGSVLVLDTGYLDNDLGIGPWPDAATVVRDVVDRWTLTASSGAVMATPGPDGKIDPVAGHGLFAGGVVARMGPDLSVTLGGIAGSDGFADAGTLLDAIVQLTNDRQPPDVVNLSLGIYTCDGRPPFYLTRALTRLFEAHPDLVLVASAGNEGLAEAPGSLVPAALTAWPAAYATSTEPFADHVVGVGAYATKDDTGYVSADAVGAFWRATFSTPGPWAIAYADGVHVIADYPEGTFGYVTADPAVGSPDGVFDNGLARWSGTSFAAPVVAAWVGSRSGPGAAAAVVAGWRALPTPIVCDTSTCS